MSDFRCIAPDVILGQNVRLAQFVNLYGCTIGDDTRLGTFVEIQKHAVIGARCKTAQSLFAAANVAHIPK
jgi:UDP-3-O-[3-hydroxymyristoyl] glucosamine N-acyltransferase